MYPENVKNHKSEIKQANNLINIQIKELRHVQSVSERDSGMDRSGQKANEKVPSLSSCQGNAIKTTVSCIMTH